VNAVAGESSCSLADVSSSPSYGSSALSVTFSVTNACGTRDVATTSSQAGMIAGVVVGVIVLGVAVTVIIVFFMKRRQKKTADATFAIATNQQKGGH
jgi:formate-dependent nitrite reductase membrane component NrfD